MAPKTKKMESRGLGSKGFVWTLREKRRGGVGEVGRVTSQKKNSVVEEKKNASSRERQPSKKKEDRSPSQGPRDGKTTPEKRRQSL